MMRLLGSGTNLLNGDARHFLRAVTEGFPGPSWIEIRGLSGVLRAPLLAPGGEPEGRLPWRKVRRLDSFSRSFVAAAFAAFDDAAISPATMTTAGTVTGTAHGPAATTFAFLDDIIAGGDDMASPVKFATSVGNAGAAAISQALDLRGPVVSTASFRDSFGGILDIASSWLGTGMCSHVVIAVGDEPHEVILHGLARRNLLSPDGVPRPLAGSGGLVPAVGTAALLVAADDLEPERHPAIFLSVEEPPSLSTYAAGGDWPVLLAADGDPHTSDFFREAASLLGERALLPGRAIGSLAANGSVLCLLAAACLENGHLPRGFPSATGEGAARRTVERVDCLFRGTPGRGYIVALAKEAP